MATNEITRGINKAGIWVGFIITISSIIGTWYNNNYRIGEIERRLGDTEMQIRQLEKMNPELLLQQLKSIESMQNQFDQKITSTNQRIDEVLKVLINK
jgi:hypothetical protein